MAIQLPAIRPTRLELQLPGYPVITGSWRAIENPEILGSIPEGAVLRLSYENIRDAEALELLLLWRASANGRFPLEPLPADVAAGVDDADLAARILDIAPLVWTVGSAPRQDSAKAGRSSVEIELVSELRLTLALSTPAITCPTYAARTAVGCVGGAGGVGNWPGYDGGDWSSGGGGSGDFARLQFNDTPATKTRSSRGYWSDAVADGTVFHLWHNDTYNGSGTQELPYLAGYNPLPIRADSTLLFNVQFVDSGWWLQGNKEFMMATVGSRLFVAFGGSDSGAVNSRIYIVEVNPSTGAIIQYRHWQQAYSSTGNAIRGFEYSPVAGGLYVYFKNSDTMMVDIDTLDRIWHVSRGVGNQTMTPLYSSSTQLAHYVSNGIRFINPATGLYEDSSNQWNYQVEDPANPGVWVNFGNSSGGIFRGATDDSDNLYIYAATLGKRMMIKIDMQTRDPVWLIDLTNFLTDYSYYALGTGTVATTYHAPSNRPCAIIGRAPRSNTLMPFCCVINPDDGTLERVLQYDDLQSGWTGLQSRRSYGYQDGVIVQQSISSTLGAGSGPEIVYYPPLSTQPETEVDIYPGLTTTATPGNCPIAGTSTRLDTAGWGMRSVRGTGTLSQVDITASWTQSPLNPGGLVVQSALINDPLAATDAGGRWALDGG